LDFNRRAELNKKNLNHLSTLGLKKIFEGKPNQKSYSIAMIKLALEKKEEI